MNKIELTTKFNDFLKRVEVAKVVINDDDKTMITTILKIISPANLRKASTAREILVRALSNDPNAEAHQQYVMVDGESIVATDGHRFAMLSNDDGLETGLYDKDFNKVSHNGDIDLSHYRKMASETREHHLVVGRDDCKIVTKPMGINIGTLQYMDIWGQLKFNVRHFTQFLNGEDGCDILYNQVDGSTGCQLVNPKYPGLTLIIMNMVV